jgi:predicted nucleic acid-binding protein
MMVLVDTSVWITHLREGNEKLVTLLDRGEVLCHPFIIGELACGTIRNRKEIVSLLQLLPVVIPANHEEVMGFIGMNRLMGKGMGYIDMCLLASARLTGIPLWTLDKKLDETAGELRIRYCE